MAATKLRKAAAKKVRTVKKAAVKKVRTVKRAAVRKVTKAVKAVRSAKAGATAAPRRTVKPRRVELKTKVSDASVPAFLASLPDAQQRSDSEILASIFGAATREAPRMWGGKIVGYGNYSYVGKSGRAGDWFLAGFAPRKDTLTLYTLGGWSAQPAILAKLGKHKVGGGCLHIRRLAEVDHAVLGTLVDAAVQRARALAPGMMVNGGQG